MSSVNPTADNQDLHKAPLVPLIMRYILPTIVAMAVTGIYFVIDGMFIGHYEGYIGLAAINLAWPLVGLIMAVGAMTGMGAGTQISAAVGRGETDKARIILFNALLLLLILSLVLTLIGLFYVEPLLALTGARGEVFEPARDYATYMFLGSVFPASGLALTMLIRNDGRPGLTTCIMMIGALANILLDYVFVAWLKWGVPGAAIATVIAQGITAIWCVAYFFSNKSNLRLTRKDAIFDLKIIRRICAIGFASLVMQLYISALILVHNKVLLKFAGDMELAAFAIIGYVETIFYLVAEGIALGLQPILSQNFGAGERKRLFNTFYMGAAMALGVGLMGVALVWVAPQTIISLFVDEGELFRQMTEHGLQLYLISLPLETLVLVAIVFFQVVNKEASANLLTIAKILLLFPVIYFMAELFGLDGIWLSMPIVNLILVLVFVALFYRYLNTSTVKK